MRILKVGLLLTFLVSVLAAASTLDVYTVDVEGGKFVLFVSPSGESLLIDVGWPAFNARPASTDRILEAVKAPGLRHIYDHGDGPGPQPEWFKAYDAVRRKVGHTVLRPGDKIPFQGVDVEVVAAA